MILIVDNFDSFTFNLVDYLYQLGIPSEVIRNDISPNEINSEKYQGILLSPGPETPKKSGYLMEYLKQFSNSKPILGICLGHQAIGEFYGATLSKAIKPMHGKVSLLRHSNHPFFKNIPSPFKAVRYHSLILKNLPEELEVLAHSEEHEIMAIKHKDLPVVGIQYHPESILTEFGLTILKNWINLLNIEPCR